MSYYELRHSSGVWKDHKYIKKEGDKYIYSKEQMAEYESHRDDDSSDGKKWAYGSGSTPLNRYNSVGEGKNAKSIAELIKAGKGGKGSSSSKNSKSDKEKSSTEKTGSTKAAKETKEKDAKSTVSSSKSTSATKTTTATETKEKEPTFQKYQVTSTGAQRALKTYADLTKKDSISTTLNADGNWESTVTYENGDTQKFIMDKRYRILSKGEREMKHMYSYNGEYLMHHGILGQKWGNQNGPPYPIPTGDHSAAEKKANKFRNIDGSINEKGIDHKRKYVERQTAKNNKRYQRYINKYNKKIEKTDDEETKKYYQMRLKNAVKTRDQVNKYFKRMGIDQIAEQEQMYKEKALKTAGIVAGSAAATALGVGAPLLIASGAKAAASFLASVDPKATMESVYAMVDTPTGRKAVTAADTAIRAYSDMRAYAFSIYADQTINRLNESGVVNKAGDLVRNSVKSTASVNVPIPTVTFDQKAAQANVNQQKHIKFNIRRHPHVVY